MNAQPEPTSQKDRVVGWVELVVALLITVWCAVLNITVLQHAGGMWRDEISSVFVASRPTLGETLSFNGVDSFPVFFSIPLHAWIAMGLGGTDFGLRLFALLPALGIVGMLWWTVRQLGGRIPLISLVLVALSPTFFRFSSGVRAYSLGVVLLLLMVGLLWRLMERPTIKRALLAALGAVLAVQTTYFNVPMLVAISAAAGIVCLRRRAWKALGLLAAVDAVAALSMLPYLARIQGDKEWSTLTQIPIDATWAFSCFQEAVEKGLTGLPMLWIWISLLVIAIGAFAYQISPRPIPTLSALTEVPLFGLAAMAAGVVCFYGFLKFLGQHTTVWYYVSIMALLAILADVAIQGLLRAHSTWRWVQVGLVAVVALWIGPSTWQVAHSRWTNIDLVADKLRTAAGPNDFIVVTNWYMGASFARYYTGSTPWSTAPGLDHQRYQDGMSFLKAMHTREVMKPVLEQIGRALASGNRVWLVGSVVPCAPGEVPGDAPANSGNAAQSVVGRYADLWQQHVYYYLKTHAGHVDSIAVPSEDPITSFEMMPLCLVQGWRSSESAKP